MFNYTVDVTDPLLSHQYEAVKYFAAQFREVIVVTGRVGDFPPLENVKIFSTFWAPKQRLQNIFRLLKTALPLLGSRNYCSVFFHMTDVQAAILSPFIWALNKPQFLWYAHTTKSKYLRFASIWVNRIVTSTSGSCPIRKSKVLPIGQAIDVSLFPFRKFHKSALNKLIHVGRFDKSKKVDEIILAVNDLRFEFKRLELLLVGSTANQDSKEWAERVLEDSKPFVEAGWLRFSGAIPKKDFANLVSSYGIFLHKYEGSLDKTLIESTLLGVPVITTNPEYLSIFGTWEGQNKVTLMSEYRSIIEKSTSYLHRELSRRAEIAVTNHSLESWGKKMSEILSERENIGFTQGEMK